MKEVHSTCRLCLNRCPILVEVEGGRPMRVRGDPAAALHRGYTCRRGRSLPQLHADPDRILHPVKRMADGSFRAITTEQAIDEVAEALRTIVDRHGPRSVALYCGTQSVQSPPSYALGRSLLEELGSPMLFSANTIDQPGKHIAAGLHGYWMAPAQGFMAPDVALWIGINPLVSYKGIPSGVPRDGIRAIHARGGKTIVIDPRQTETAELASLHLQLRPGEDATVIAGLLHVIIRDGLVDRAFIAAHVDGFEALARHVADYTPNFVARRAGLAADNIETAARWFGTAGRGYAVAGTGGAMGAARGTLLEYLVLCLDTICGHYLRAGEVFTTPAPLAPTPKFKAQASPPVPAHGFGETLRASGRPDSLAGLQVTDLPDEILYAGEGRVRALFNLGGNPAVAWPDQKRTIEALDALDLLVSFDVRMSQTAKRSTHVFASTMCLEIPGYQTASSATVGYANSYSGYAGPWSQYTPAIATPPEGSDLVEEWVVFYEIAKRLDLQLTWTGAQPFQIGPPKPGSAAPKVDMARRPTHDEILELWTGAARVPLSEVKAHPSGALFPPADPIRVAPADPGWTGHLDVGNAEMMADLAGMAAEQVIGSVPGEFRLLNRRGLQINSNYNIEKVNRGLFYNPMFVHPEDLHTFGMEDGDRAVISSATDNIVAIAKGDSSVMPGTISMQHCFGEAPPGNADVEQVGSAINRLLSVSFERDRYSGQPIMSNVAVRITPLAKR